MENMKFAELKVLAKSLGWAAAHEGVKKNFIGVAKQDIINFIENAQVAEQKTEGATYLKDGEITIFTEGKHVPIEAVKAHIEITPPAAQPEPVPAPEGDLITLKVISSMLGITEKSLRRKLRQKGMVKPGGRWEWAANHADLPIIMAWKEEA